MKQRFTDEQMLEALAKHGSVRATAKALGMTRSNLQHHLDRMGAQKEVANGSQEAPADPIYVRRLRDENNRLRLDNAALERRVIESEDIRSSVLGLMDAPLKPRLVVPSRRAGGGGGRKVVLHLTDCHFGETVSLEEMDGVNAYDAKIAKARLGRFFSKAADLCTKHWTEQPPEEIILCLGGDLISGNIHAELAETNYPSVPATVREVGELISGGIVLLSQQVKCPIRVYSVPGNHGRLTLKPTAKKRAAMSLDLLATDFAEACTRGAGVKNVQFFPTQSPDAYFSVYAFNFLLNHGDTTGSKGGQGYIGPAATIVRGHRKLMDTSWRAGKAVHYILTGHLHTTLRSSFGWAGGSVVGPSEYGRDLRADPEPAKQNMLVVHEKNGVIEHKELYLGHPSEGSIYAGPAVVMRPFAEAA